MAKKIVRGITDVKTINNQDFDTNNVNDLLSDGQYNYIHRKKGKNEEYHNLTDNIKTLSSDNTELLSVTNYNKTTNTALLSPKHDKQKEQVIESTRNTITIRHATNGTAEKTTVDTNPEKVLEHENLVTDYGISKITAGNNTTLGLEYTKADNLDLNELENGRIRGANLLNAPSNEFYFVDSYTEYNYCIQEAVKLTDYLNTTYRRLKNNGVWGEWREQVGDKSVIDDLLAQKQDTLTAGEGITIQGHTISATGGGAPVQGATLSIQGFADPDFKFLAYKHVVTIGDDVSGYQVLTTFSFDCYDGAETVITGELKTELEPFISTNRSISNAAITITNDGTNIKLINSKSTENVVQQATFTFYDFIPNGGGGGGVMPE